MFNFSEISALDYLNSIDIMQEHSKELKKLKK